MSNIFSQMLLKEKAADHHYNSRTKPVYALDNKAHLSMELKKFSKKLSNVSSPNTRIITSAGLLLSGIVKNWRSKGHC